MILARPALALSNALVRSGRFLRMRGHFAVAHASPPLQSRWVSNQCDVNEVVVRQLRDHSYEGYWVAMENSNKLTKESVEALTNFFSSQLLYPRHMEKFFEAMPDMTLVPQTVKDASILRVGRKLAEQRRMRRLRRLFALSTGFSESVRLQLFNYHLYAMSVRDRLNGTLDLLNSARDSGIVPNADSYHIALACCLRCDPKSSNDVLERMRADGVPHRITTYALRLHHMALSGNTSALHRLLRELIHWPDLRAAMKEAEISTDRIFVGIYYLSNTSASTLDGVARILDRVAAVALHRQDALLLALVWSVGCFAEKPSLSSNKIKTIGMRALRNQRDGMGLVHMVVALLRKGGRIPSYLHTAYVSVAVDERKLFDLFYLNEMLGGYDTACMSAIKTIPLTEVCEQPLRVKDGFRPPTHNPVSVFQVWNDLQTVKIESDMVSRLGLTGILWGFGPSPSDVFNAFVQEGVTISDTVFARMIDCIPADGDRGEFVSLLMSKYKDHFGHLPTGEETMMSLINIHQERRKPHAARAIFSAALSDRSISLEGLSFMRYTTCAAYVKSGDFEGAEAFLDWCAEQGTPLCQAATMFVKSRGRNLGNGA